MDNFQACYNVMNLNNWTFNEDIISEGNPEQALIQKEEWFGGFSKEAQDLVRAFILLDSENKQTPTMTLAKPIMRKLGYSWKKIESAKKEVLKRLQSL